MDTMPTSNPTTSRTYSFADDAPISLDLKNHSGDVVVLLDAPEGTAEVTLRTSRPLDLEPVVTSCHRGRVRVEIPALLGADGSRGFAFSLGPISIGVGNERVDVEVHLPHGADLAVSTKEGDIVVQGVSGLTEVRSGSGDLRVDETARLRAATGSGDVTVGRCTGGSVTSGSGDIDIETAAGPDTLEVRTGSGDVSLADNRHDLIVATGSGDISASHHHGSLTARTGTGDVDLTVPRGIPVWLDLTSAMGDVFRDLDPMGAPAEGQEHLSVTIRTGTGDIRVHH
ncbi:DUF4097 family beta strand repeat-containing protein [Ornithinimicrobium panacihumi]|uniref:DUF4097 family beta strand repeat-containing protein n=1 Tax=Ornithinimicrobium panacihumi TaxID=2008449 RepID=UPI003F898A42